MHARQLSLIAAAGVTLSLLAQAVPAHAQIALFEAAGANAAAITPTRDNFRAALGGGTVAGANGSFGGLRREINWDGVPETLSDPNALPANFFNVNSPRGAVFSTPGTGFLVSANAGGATPVLFGFPSDFQTFSPQKLFTAVNSNITDVNFFVPGTNTPATVTGFGAIFVDVETAGLTSIQFFGQNGTTLIFQRDVLVAGNQGLSFTGIASGIPIGRVRITSGSNTIVSNGTLGNQVDDIVVMDDFIYSEPTGISNAAPEPTSLAFLGTAALGLMMSARRRRRSRG